MLLKLTYKKQLFLIAVVLLFVGMLLTACTTPAQKEIRLVWPLPPELPKIVYIRSYHGEDDFKKSSVLDTLLGEEVASRKLRKPYGVSAYNGKVYVSDTSLGAVFVFNERDKKTEFLGTEGIGRLAMPIGIAVDKDNTVFVADVKQKRIFGYDETGELKVSMGKEGELDKPAGIAINRDLGRLYVADSYGHVIHVYSTKGDFLFNFGKRGDEDGNFNFPTNVAVDSIGKVYVVDTQNFRVQIFDQDGKFIKKFGKIGDSVGFFSRPKGIGIDSDNNIYVADAAFDNFQIFNENGEVLLFVGGPGHEPGYFWLPAGAYVDENDRIYVVDSYNFRVQVFQYLSKKWIQEHPEEYKIYSPE
jgi:DNA-binding beta-propeller fold protein YncE